MSPSGMGVQTRLSDFEPTEQEFREMVRLEKAFDEEFGLPRETFSPEEARRRKTGRAELERQIKGLLGEQRYREFKAKAAR